MVRRTKRARMARRERKARKKANQVEKNFWHPAYVGAVGIELEDFMDQLDLESEHDLAKLPMKIDLLVVKKEPDVEVTGEIGELFRGHNLIEFKSPRDELGIDDYCKAFGSALVYKSQGATVDEISLDDITLTFLRARMPEKLMDRLRQEGAKVEERHPGVFDVTGGRFVLFPTQILVANMLDRKRHAALRLLTDTATEEDFQEFMEQASKFTSERERNNADAVLEVSIRANREVFQKYRRDREMGRYLDEMMKDKYEERDVAAYANSVGSVMGRYGISLERAMEDCGVPKELRKKVAASVMAPTVA